MNDRSAAVSGGAERNLAFAGAISGLDHPGPILVVDIGVGSTKFSVGTVEGGLAAVYSADIGASVVTDTYLESDPPRAAELSAALSVIAHYLADVRRELPGLSEALGASGKIVGVGGTITTVAAVELGLVEPSRDLVHGLELPRPAVEDVFRTLATESAADRRHNPGLHPNQVELIVGGACVLVETMRQFEIDQITVSESDLQDGATAELMAP